MIPRIFLAIWIILALIVMAKAETYRYVEEDGTVSEYTVKTTTKTYDQVKRELDRARARQEAITAEVVDLEAVLAEMPVPVVPEPIDPNNIMPVNWDDSMSEPIVNWTAPILDPNVINWDQQPIYVKGINWTDVSVVVPEFIDWTNDEAILFADAKPRMHYQIEKPEPVRHDNGVAVDVCVEWKGVCAPTTAFETVVTSEDL